LFVSSAWIARKKAGRKVWISNGEAIRVFLGVESKKKPGESLDFRKRFSVLHVWAEGQEPAGRSRGLVGLFKGYTRGGKNEVVAGPDGLSNDFKGGVKDSRTAFSTVGRKKGFPSSREPRS